MNTRLVIIIISFLLSINTYSNNSCGGKDSIAYFNKDFTHNFILHVDSMINNMYSTSLFVKPLTIKNKYGFSKDSIPVYADIIHEYRMAKLDTKTPIKLEYNSNVKSQIDLYTIRQRSYYQKVLGRAEYYFPIFEEALDRHDLPLELKYLAVVESGLNPNARSKSGALGLWQFMYNTGTIFGLRSTSFIDERKNPIKSTDAACKYLKYLHTTFNDWQLALAAYNGGPGVVRNAIERSGGKTTFWEIRPFLPKETQNYVPAFMAVNYVFAYQAEHNAIINDYGYKSIDNDTILITKPIYLSKISEISNVPLRTLKELNPMFKKGYIPAIEDTFVLIIPRKKVLEFIQNKDKAAISTYNSSSYKDLPSANEVKKDRIKITHTVRKGEYFHKLAVQYNCTMENIKTWNNLDSNNIHSNQKLDIWIENSINTNLVTKAQ